MQGSTHHRTSPPTTNTTPHKQKRERGQHEREAQTMQGGWTHPKMGTPHNTPPPFNTATEQTKEGRRHSREGDTTRETGRPATQPPFTHHATHHPLCHPTTHDGPTLHHDEGGSTQRIPHHTNSTDTHSPLHTTHPATNSARHESQYSPALQWDE